MSETYELTREITIEASPETVFGFLTEESKMKEWFGEVVYWAGGTPAVLRNHTRAPGPRWHNTGKITFKSYGYNKPRPRRKS